MSQHQGILKALLGSFTAALVATLAGCGSDSPSSAAVTCTPDPALVAAGRACRTDDECPCGAGCSLGVCGAQCASSADCAGGSCDRFGRCRAAGDDAVIPGLAVEPQHRIDVSPRLLYVAGASVARTVRIKLHGAAGEAVRVAADDGVEVRCAADGAFGKECRIDAAPVDALIPIDARASTALAAGSSRQVRVYYGDAMETVTLSPQPLGATIPKTSTFKGPSGPLTAGVFSGQLSLRALGVSKDAAAAGVTTEDVVVPVDAQLFVGTSGSGALVLKDPLRLLLPTGEWIGRVTATATDAGTIDFPTVAYASGEATKGAGVEVLLEAPAATYAAGSTSISFQLITRFSGVLMGDRLPQARWQVSLTRTGDLPTGALAPSVPADAVATLATSRGLVPTPWEAAIAKAATPTSTWVSSATGYEVEKRELLGVYGRSTATDGTLVACNLSTGSAAALAMFAVRDAFGAEPTAAKHPLATALATALAGKTAVTATTSLDWTTGARVMPCKVSFAAVTPAFTGACSPASESPSVALGTVDLCADMATAYGCTPSDSTGATLTVSADVTYKDASACARVNHAVSIPGTVERVCTLPVVPAPCAELAMCYEPIAGATATSVRAPYLGSDALPLSGDLKCKTGARSFALDVDVNAELATTDPSRLKAGAIAAECAADLAKIRDAAPPTLASYGDGLKTALVDGKCASAARYYYALGLATDADRRRATDPNAPISPLASAATNRLLGRWLSEHAFVAREAAEAERMAQVFRGGGDASDPTTVPASQSLGQSLAAWQLILHPRFATALDQMPASLVRAPDYRPLATGAAPVPNADHEQSAPVCLAILETLEAQLALVDAITEAAALAGDAKAYEPLAQVLRQGHVARSIAADMAARAVADAVAQGLPAPAWLTRYQLDAKNVQALLQRLIFRVDAARLGKNPLGIDAQDTPLYFFGDEATATTRFSAISDFLIGQPGGSAWVPTMVSRSTTALSDARTSWLAKRDRAVSVKQTVLANEQHLDAIRAKYGEQLGELCGGPSTLGTNELVEKWTTFDANTCHVRSELTGCSVDTTAYAALMSLEDVKYQLCVVGELRKKYKSGVGLLDPALDGLADAPASLSTASFPAACTNGAHDCLTYSVSGGAKEIHVTPGSFLFLKQGVSAAADDYAAAQATCATTYPTASTSLPSADLLASSPASTNGCLTGSIGEGVFEIRAIDKDLEIARSELADLSEQYRIAMQSCIIQNAGNGELESAQKGLATTMTVLGAVKLGADIVSTVCGATKDCMSMMQSISAESAAAGYGLVGFLVGCQAAVIGGAADIASLSLQYSMDTVQQWHDVNVLQISNRTAMKQCANDAELNLVGSRTAMLRVQRANMDLQAAYRRQQSMVASAQGVYDEGKAALYAAEGRTVAPVSHDLWADERIDTFLSDMRVARRVSYLAVRAVEYETQQSLGLGAKVLSATHPKQLQVVLDELWATAATRGVNGKRPTDLKVVLSMRDQLLQLGDKTKLPPSEQTLSPTERFRLILRDARFAVYDAAGVYKGQRIPFEIAPLSALKLGQAEGIPVLSSGDCAERLWSVNASVLGPAAMYKGTAPSFTRVELQKQNTFYSQWCTATDTSFQLASVRPSRNLFREPGLSSSIGTTTGATGEASEYTTARIEAYFNVDRKTFEADTYANGQTAELAARGLYGKYALFIPAEMLSKDGGGGLVLNQIEDVLLRLDYVSVAR